VKEVRLTSSRKLCIFLLWHQNEPTKQPTWSSSTRTEISDKTRSVSPAAWSYCFNHDDFI
jgi:hypothetical protein